MLRPYWKKHLNSGHFREVSWSLNLPCMYKWILIIIYYIYYTFSCFSWFFPSFISPTSGTVFQKTIPPDPTLHPSPESTRYRKSRHRPEKSRKWESQDSAKATGFGVYIMFFLFFFGRQQFLGSQNLGPRLFWLYILIWCVQIYKNKKLVQQQLGLKTWTLAGSKLCLLIKTEITK